MFRRNWICVCVCVGVEDEGTYARSHYSKQKEFMQKGVKNGRAYNVQSSQTQSLINRQDQRVEKNGMRSEKCI